MRLPRAAYIGFMVQNDVSLATQWLHGATKAKPRYLYGSGVPFAVLVPER
jgi:hypothetical protein